MDVAGVRVFRQRVRGLAATYIANADPLSEAANTAALLVWSSQPLYPLYVWLLVGADAWPSFLTWLSTPIFFSVPLVGRRSPIGGRALFVVAGVANTLLSTKAFGVATSVGWFLVPCFLIVAGFFRTTEWTVAGTLGLLCLGSVPLTFHVGAPLVAHTAPQNTSLSHLNLWSVVVLSVYLVVAAVRARRAGR